MRLDQKLVMSVKNIISLWLKTLASIALVFALVLSPPAASHAASGTHSDHHSVGAVSPNGDSGHKHDVLSKVSEIHADGDASLTDAKDQTSIQCCNDICMSVVLCESRLDLIMHSATGKYPMLRTQTASVEQSGFLRPPQFLI